MSNTEIDEQAKSKDKKEKKSKKVKVVDDISMPDADTESIPTKKDKKRKRDDAGALIVADDAIEVKKAKKDKRENIEKKERKKKEKNEKSDSVTAVPAGETISDANSSATIKAPEEKQVKKAKKSKTTHTEEPVLPSALSNIAFIAGPESAEPASTTEKPASIEHKDEEKRKAPKAERKHRKKLKKDGITDEKELDRLVALAFPPEDTIKGIVTVEADNSKKAKTKASKKAKSKQKDGDDTATEKEDRDGNAGVSIKSKEPLGDVVVPPKQHRFITFVGNLPFTATKEDIAKHFSAVKPAEIRLMTNKETGISKGYAFVEFDRYDSMKSCLGLYHHSKFDDGTPQGRRINVELTVGGGGAKDNRKSKIKEKNDSLRKEQLGRRQRQKDEEDKAKVEAAGGVWKGRNTQQSGEGKGVGKKDKTTKSEDPAATGLSERTGSKPAEPVKPKVVATDDPHAGIHPSRLRQMTRY